VTTAADSAAKPPPPHFNSGFFVRQARMLDQTRSAAVAIGIANMSVSNIDDDPKSKQPASAHRFVKHQRKQEPARRVTNESRDTK
jgi:SOS-response transcriptional repressor LexA